MQQPFQPSGLLPNPVLPVHHNHLSCHTLGLLPGAGIAGVLILFLPAASHLLPHRQHSFFTLLPVVEPSYLRLSAVFRLLPCRPFSQEPTAQLDFSPA